MSRAVVPAFVLYAAVAVFAAYGARVVASKVDRGEVIESPLHQVGSRSREVTEWVSDSSGARPDSVTAEPAAGLTTPRGHILRDLVGDPAVAQGAAAGPGGSR